MRGTACCSGSCLHVLFVAVSENLVACFVVFNLIIFFDLIFFILPITLHTWQHLHLLRALMHFASCTKLLFLVHKNRSTIARLPQQQDERHARSVSPTTFVCQ